MYDIPPIKKLLVSNASHQDKICANNNPLKAKHIERLYTFLNRKGHRNFRVFKQSWLARIIKQRYEDLQLKTLQEYITYCESAEGENEWKQLEHHLFPSPLYPDRHIKFLKLLIQYTPTLINHLTAKGKEILPARRIWIPWCRSGELAYTLAYYANTLHPEWINVDKLKISTTDTTKLHSIKFDIKLLRTLRTVITKYTKTNLLSSKFNQQPEWLQHNYIRSQIYAGYHDPITSYPYRNIDLIICDQNLDHLTHRNREKIANCFHQSLTNHGLIWLMTNNRSVAPTYFTELHQNPNLYHKNESLRSKPIQNKSHSDRPTQLTPLPHIFNIVSNHQSLDSRMKYQIALNQLFEQIAFPAILVDTKGAIQHTIGNTSAFLKPLSQGPFSDNFMELVPIQLKALMTPAFEKIVTHGEKQKIPIPKSLSNAIFDHNQNRSQINRNQYASVQGSQPLTEIELIKLSDTYADYTFIAIVFKLDVQQDQLHQDNIDQTCDTLDAGQKALTKQKIEKLEKLILELSTDNDELRLMNKNLEFVNRELSKKYEDSLLEELNQ